MKVFRAVAVAIPLAFVSPASAQSTAAPRPVWSAVSAEPITETVVFVSGAARLTGTLYLPRGKSSSPLVIVYHGASDALRTAPLYKHLIRMLPPLGIGVFVYDRRGSGDSTGPSAGGSFLTLTDDGIAARQVLAKDRRIDARRIGYWGLSQGGWLSALAATRDPKCAFSISISAPMVTADLQMNFAVANILRIRGYDEKEVAAAVAARVAVDQFMRGETDRASAQRQLDFAASQPWFPYIYMNRTFADPAQSAWAQEMKNDPLEVMGEIRTPTLILYGSNDPWVPVTTSVERLQAIGRSHPNVARYVISGADHAMMTSLSQLEQVDPASMAQQAPEAPEYFAIMTRWLTELGITRRQRPA